MTNDTPISLSAKFTHSFAYSTLKDRLPIIVTQIIDHLSRDKDIISGVYGNESKDELKEIVGGLAKLKNEMQTDKPLIPLIIDAIDTNLWNESLLELQNKMNATPTWYSAPWLYIESYMYRRMFEVFECSKSLKDFDYFRKQKENALTSSSEAVLILGQHLKNIINDTTTEEKLRIHLSEMIKISLWSNRCDLSLSSESSQKSNPVTSLSALQPKILADNTDSLIDFILKTKLDNSEEGINIDIILDNAGFELFCDFCLAHFLCASKLVKKIRFFVKRMPWYVSDVTADDFTWVMNALKNLNQQDNVILQELADTWQQYVRDSIWVIETEFFWTYPYPYCEVKKYDEDLYKKLSEADLIIFKGDLNYRKLTGDRMWDYTTAFDTALGGFNPSPLCSLRTLKADTVVGLAPGQAEDVEKVSNDWMITGEYAVIQFTQTII